MPPVASLLFFRGFGHTYSVSDTIEQEQPNQPSAPPEPPKKSGVWGWLAAAGLLFAGKAKFFLGLLKVAKFGKFLPTALSMGVMIWIEAVRHGIAFGVGFVVLILIHELGHGVAIRQSGLRAGPIVFLPFMGAVIALKDHPQNAKVEAHIAYGGPFWGTIGACATAALYFATGQRLFLALAYTGFFLNLFNLVPVTPFDGGRITQAFSRKTWIIGLVMLGTLMFFAPSPQIAIIAMIALFSVFTRKDQIYPELNEDEKFGIMARYFALAGFLGAAMYFSHQILERIG